MNSINTKKIVDELAALRLFLTIPLSEFISIDEAAELLRLKKSYLYNLVYKKQIPYYKPNGKKLYFKKDELLGWIMDSKVKTVQEVEQELSSSKNQR